MSTCIAEFDHARTQQFYARDDAAVLIGRYMHEMDSELRADMDKAALYVMLREQGVDSVFANMRACRRTPGAANVDRHFCSGQREKMEGMAPKARDRIVRIAQRAGISTQGKFYVGGLGRYHDPGAWVSTIDDVLATAKKRNLNVDGVVRHKAVSGLEPPSKPPLAEDLVTRYVRKYTTEDPGLGEQVKRSPKKMRELREKVIATHGKVKR